MQTGEVGMQHFRGVYILSDLNHFFKIVYTTQGLGSILIV